MEVLYNGYYITNRNNFSSEQVPNLIVYLYLVKLYSNYYIWLCTLEQLASLRTDCDKVAETRK